MMSTAAIQFFESDQGRLGFRVFGSGPAMLLTFHGFGQSSLAYEPLQAQIGDQFTVYAFDLFLHGTSQRMNDSLLTKTDWQRFIDDFLQAQKIDRFSLMGFSLGGRFALATVEAFADRIDQLLLIAPDGITRSFWYELATSTGAGRTLFRYGLRHLPVLNTIGYALVRLGLLNRTAMRFAEISLATPEQRSLVYQTWTRFRLVRPNLAAIADLLNNRPGRVRFFTGAFDRLVPGRYILPLTDRLHRYELTVLKTGHNHLIELAGEAISSMPAAQPATVRPSTPKSTRQQ